MKYLTTEEAAQAFPRACTRQTVLARIKDGVGGVKLRAIWDGDRWLTTEEWIAEYLRQQSKDGRITVRPVEDKRKALYRKYGWSDRTAGHCDGTTALARRGQGKGSGTGGD